MPYPFARPYLTTCGLVPENQESPIHFIEPEITSARYHFRRNHFLYPNLLSFTYWIPIRGNVERPMWISLKELYDLPSVTVSALLECAGNKRSLFEPKVFGEQWEKGAMSQGNWRGVQLRILLEMAGIQEGSVEVVVEGCDRGKRKDSAQEVSYTRSLPLEKAMHPDTLVAYAYNDRPIPFKHGFPLRLIVPGWYGMASVKWIKQIEVSAKPFTGPFQTKDYVYYPEKDSDAGAFPVTAMNVNSSILHPTDRDILSRGIHVIEGLAWSGSEEIVKVDISVDNGTSWAEAELDNDGESGYHWIRWSYEWEASHPGEFTILSKSTDASEQVQPSSPLWNRKGYGYNAVDKVKVKVE
ncbi:sulfite oxidase [Alteribacter keqinensis]|uniref:Sulfite oxidase n=1 Tax=Alteribacter keqinensis TaxID=2483800 RepID=A0A3M7TMX2_9BACI|nr:sulfite oxidase [Alteribacter keqinensis]RNA66983.1 sulfite oxidase [Alteribacter keqinensis]